MHSLTDRRRLRTLISCLITLPLLGYPAKAMSDFNSPIDQVLRKLPADAFDDTTDGIDDDDLKKLVETGETTDWKLKRLDPQAAVATDKNPHTNSEVAIHVFKIGTGKIVGVKIQNEYRHTEHYYKMGTNGSLKLFSPSKKLKAKLKSEGE